jgi:hypothetical protein
MGDMNVKSRTTRIAVDLKALQIRSCLAVTISMAVALSSPMVFAQDLGKASGSGSIISVPEQPNRKEQRVAFAPKFAFAYVEGSGATLATWIVLTEKAPPVAAWASARDRTAARQLWCQNEKAAFVAVKLDADNDADLFLCPPGAAMSNSEMTSTANGLKSIDVKFTARSSRRVTGTLRGGVGNCPKADGTNAYCVQYSEYTFDAPMTR